MPRDFAGDLQAIHDWGARHLVSLIEDHELRLCGVEALPRAAALHEVMTVTTMNISPPEEMKRWVESQSRTGRFGNSSDYVRELIRRDQERQAKIAHVQQMLDEGLRIGVRKLTMTDLRKLARSKVRT